MRVLIAGAGYVGVRLAELLASEGHDVTVLKRGDAQLPSGVALVRGDLSIPSSLTALPRTFDAVVYAAAADRRDEAAYRAAYLAGPRHLFEQVASPGRIVFMSSTSVYGQRDGSVVNEVSPTEPKDVYGEIMLAAEEAILALEGSIVLRLGGIYGPGRTRLVDMVRQGTARLAPHGGGYTNRIHRDDCARAIAHLLALAEPRALYVGVDHEPVLKNDVLLWLARALGVPSLPASEGPVDLGKRCDSARLVQSGFTFRFPTYREGYGALVGA